MFKAKSILVLVSCLFLMCALPTSEGNQKPKGGNELVRLRAVQTSAGPQLEIKAGDFTCTTSELTVRRKQGEPFTVKPANGKVQVHRGGTISEAGQIEIALRF